MKPSVSPQIALILTIWALESLESTGGLHVGGLFRRPKPTVTHQLLEERLHTFAQPSSINKNRVQTLSMEDSDESEWYVPPPPKAQTATHGGSVDSEPATSKLPLGVTASETVIESNADLLKFLGEDDRLCVVKFHANWCKSCQKFDLHFAKLARKKADWVDKRTGALVKKNQIRVASVEWNQCQSLSLSLGITKLPTVLFYAKGCKLGEVSVGASNFAHVVKAVDQFSTFGSQEMDFAAKMEEGAALIQAHVLQPAPDAANAAATKSAKSVKSLETSASSGPFMPPSPMTEKPAPRKRWWAERKPESAEQQ